MPPFSMNKTCPRLRNGIIREEILISREITRGNVYPWLPRDLSRLFQTLMNRVSVSNFALPFLCVFFELLYFFFFFFLRKFDPILRIATILRAKKMKHFDRFKG